MAKDRELLLKDCENWYILRTIDDIQKVITAMLACSSYCPVDYHWQYYPDSML